MHTRHITPLLQDALADTPVVLVNGARQSGKSTLVQSLSMPAMGNANARRYLTLDDTAVLRAAACAATWGSSSRKRAWTARARELASAWNRRVGELTTNVPKDELPYDAEVPVGLFVALAVTGLQSIAIAALSSGVCAPLPVLTSSTRACAPPWSRPSSE